MFFLEWPRSVGLFMIQVFYEISDVKFCFAGEVLQQRLCGTVSESER